MGQLYIEVFNLLALYMSQLRYMDLVLFVSDAKYNHKENYGNHLSMSFAPFLQLVFGSSIS